MNVVDPNGQHVWEFFGARKASNGVDWLAYDFVKNTIKGIGAGFSCHHGTRAHGGSSMGGIIRADELQNGIKHALAVSVIGAQLNRNAPGGRTFVWPASGSDSPDRYSSVGNVYMGTLLAIPIAVNLDALPFKTVQGKNVAIALQRYGAYIVDGVGGSGTKLVFSQEYTARAEVPPQNNGDPFKEDLKLAAAYLKVISNNGANSIGGGGTPLAPLPPPLAQLGASGEDGGDVLASNPRHTPDTSIPLATAVVAVLSLNNLRQTRRVRTKY